MAYSHYGIESQARELVGNHGVRARQQVVDKIVAAIRNHDLPAAKRWERIAAAVDEQLGSESGPSRRGNTSAELSRP